MKDTQGVYTDGKWEFDSNVADCFEDMLSRSIPQYDFMRKSVIKLIESIFELSPIKQTRNILDLGCSDGIMLKQMVDSLNPEGTHFLGVDISEPMLDKAKHRLIDELISGQVQLKNLDLRTEYPQGMFDIVTSILSIQFTPIEHRQHIIQNIYNSLSNTNGALIMVEKVLGNTDKINNLLVDEYYSIKRDNGYTQEQIDRKRLSLEGVLVPVTNDWNIDLLKQAGFRQVDVFWRCLNFVGYIAIK